MIVHCRALDPMASAKDRLRLGAMAQHWVNYLVPSLGDFYRDQKPTLPLGILPDEWETDPGVRIDAMREAVVEIYLAGFWIHPTLINSVDVTNSRLLSCAAIAKSGAPGLLRTRARRGPESGITKIPESSAEVIAMPLGSPACLPSQRD